MASPKDVNLFDEQPTDKPQEPQLDLDYGGAAVDDPALQQTQVDPGQALVDGLSEGYDQEGDIYDTSNVRALNNLLHGAISVKAPPPQQEAQPIGKPETGQSLPPLQLPEDAQQAGPPDVRTDSNMNFLEDMQANQFDQTQQAIDGLQAGFLKDAAQGLQNFNEAVQSRNNPLSLAGELETAKGIAGGATEGLFLAPANLLDYAFTEANLNIAQTLTGKSRDELLSEDGGLSHFLYHKEHRELPDWLKTDTLHGNLANGISQFAAGYTGIGALGKLGMVKNIASGLENAAMAAPWVQKIAQGAGSLAEQFPTLSKTAQFGLKALQVDLKARATDFISFDAQEGNLANLVADLAGNRLGVVSDISKYMAVDKSDTELEGRLKNSLTGQFMEVPGMAVLSSVKLLKSLNKANEYFKNLNGEIKAGTQEAKRAIELLTDLNDKVKQFDVEWEKVAQQDPQQIMDMLFPNGTARQAEHAGDVHLNASMDEDGNLKASISHQEAEHPQTHPNGKQPVEILDPEAPIDEAVEKSLKAEQRLLSENGKSQKAAALRQALQEQAKQRQAAFDTKGFTQRITEKIRNGEPVSIVDEFAEAMPEKDLTDVDAFAQHWRKVIKATTKEIQRRETNPEQVQRAVERVFRLNLKLGEAGDRLQEEFFHKVVNEGVESITATNNAIETLNMLEIQAKALGQKRLEVDQLYWDALTTRDESLKQEALAAVREQDLKEKVIDTLIQQQRSEAGRLLQSTQTDEALQDAAWKEVQRRFEQAKRDLPVGLSDGDEISEAEAALRARITQEILTTHDAGAVGAKAHTAKYVKLFVQSATGRTVAGGAIGGAAGAASNPNNPLQGGLTGAAIGGGLGLMSTSKGGRYALGVAREIFYNNVLNSFETFKAIPFSTMGMKGYESASNLIGALARADMERFLQAKDEIEGFIRYFGEGTMASLSVLGTGAKHSLDYTPESLRLISAEGLRQTFGQSIGDYFSNTIFNKPAQFADRLIDLFGYVYNIPTKNVLGALDTPFMVANQRAIVYRELKAVGRSRGMDDVMARQFATQKTGEVVHDLIIGRAHSFDSQNFSPWNGVFNLQQLKNLNEMLKGSTDQIRLAHPLRDASSPFAVKTPNAYYASNSDRAIFRTLGKLDDIAREFGIVGTWDFGFIKTFANVMQTGVDNTPILSLLSPHNQKVALGEMGEAARQNLIGKQVLGFGLALAGFGLAQSGMVSPIAGSKGAKSLEKQMTGESTYTLNFPIGQQKAITLDLAKGSPFVDTVMIPARFWQFAHEAREGNLDTASATFAGVTAAGEAFGSTRFLRGFSVKLDALLDPTYSTAENFYRNVLVGGAYSILPLGGRGWDNLTRFTDESYRDPQLTGEFGRDILNYWWAKTPWGSHESSPAYDWIGEERPRDDYIGTTQMFAQNATRLLTPIGIKYVNDDELVKEFQKFGEQGKAITPPHKSLTLALPEDGISLPLPLEQYRNAEGESLWDAYNKEFRDIRRKEMTPYKWLNDFVSSDVYQNRLTDNRPTRVTGKAGTILGSRWTELAERYQSLKDEAKDKLLGKPEYREEYRNALGQSINDVLRAIRNEKRQQEQPLPAQGNE